jgi:hypothetical protein
MEAACFGFIQASFIFNGFTGGWEYIFFQTRKNNIFLVCWLD